MAVALVKFGVDVSAPLPIKVLLLPVVMLKPAADPTRVFPCPEVLLTPAAFPKKALSLAVLF